MQFLGETHNPQNNVDSRYKCSGMKKCLILDGVVISMLLSLLQMTLNFLQRVLGWAPQLLQGNWAYGNAVLAVGRNVLQHHSTDLIYNGLSS